MPKCIATPLTILDRNKCCNKCVLHTEATNVCIPTRLAYSFTDKPGSNPKNFPLYCDTAVFIVGEAPGFNEDKQDACFVGKSGEKLDYFYIHGGHLPQYADVFLGNVVRCRPPMNITPLKSQIDACREYLTSDIQTLKSRYKRVVVLCVGSPATKAMTGRSLDAQFDHQGEVTDGVTYFATYHPAYTLRNPAMDRPVMRHVMQVWEYLATGCLSSEVQPPIEDCPPVEDGFNGPLSIDIETWGILNYGPHQKTYHPVKAHHLDKVSYFNMIVTVGICWRDPKGAYRTGIFKFKNLAHRKVLAEWISKASELWGQNLPFDIKFLRAVPWGLKTPASGQCITGANVIPVGTPLVDLMVESFLWDDLAPERRLKAISPAYRIASYADDKKATRAYSSPNSPDLHRYNCKDAWTTYRCIEVARAGMLSTFGEHPIAKSKLSDTRVQWFSDQLWVAILMEEDGVCFDMEKLEKIHHDLGIDLERIISTAQSKHGLAVMGKGSNSHKEEVINSAARLAISNTIVKHGQHAPETRMVTEAIADLERTKVKRNLSASADNRNILMGLVPVEDEESRDVVDKLALIGQAEGIKKLMGSYTATLLYGRKLPDKKVYKLVPRVSKKAGSRLKKKKVKAIPQFDKSTIAIRRNKREGIAYPRWFTIPKGHDDKSGKGGGVRQFRWSAKDPAIQTLPPIIKGCLSSRYRPGILSSWDYSQIEWRCAAFMSRDAAMLYDISNGVDVHTRSAIELLGAPRFDPIWVLSKDARSILTRAPDYKVRDKALVFYTWLHNEVISKGGTANKARMATKQCMDFAETIRVWLRQNGGKSQNFAYLYGGGAPVIQRTIRVKTGMEVSLMACKKFINNLDLTYPDLANFRQRLIGMVLNEGALHLPHLGQSRSFGTDREAITKQYRPQILDFPIQTISSNILQGAVREVMAEFKRSKMAARVVMNWHDAIIVDHPTNEFHVVDCIVRDKMKCNRYLSMIEEQIGDRFPIDLSYEEVARRE